MREEARLVPEYAVTLQGHDFPDWMLASNTEEFKAADVLLVLVDVVRDAAAAGALRPIEVPPLAPELVAQLEHVQSTHAEGVPLPVLARLFEAFGQLLGTITLELFGHFVGSVDPSGPFYELTVVELADRLGLPES